MVRVLFLHPDLGIGGAERAVIDAALALKSKGHEVQFVTAHHDSSHCFQETKDGTLKVTCVGDWLPRKICGKFYALCAYIRMIYAALYVVFSPSVQFDVVFCDQISACIPVLLLSLAKIIFYCHFPDMLLTKRKSFLKTLYRKPLDKMEEYTTGMAHKVLVNSHFTAGIFKDTFKSLGHVQPTVLYPIPDFNALNKPVDEDFTEKLPKKPCLFLSINRYERKKNISLAVMAFEMLVEKHGTSKVHLIIAGGYDERVTENREYFKELQDLVDKLGLTENVTFLRSFSDAQKRSLLTRATSLLYTPENEHFGIVPIEAMYLECPVIAANSGGPLETVADGATGYLCDPVPDRFSEAMSNFVTDDGLRKKLGEAGKQRVIEKFSFKQFTEQLCGIVENLAQDKSHNISPIWILTVISVVFIIIVLCLPWF
ncbi:alpha-1,3/1,6-mannosyltransferase ALG2-like [Crassostrea virginica]